MRISFVTVDESHLLVFFNGYNNLIVPLTFSLVRQSAGKLELTWPPPQTDEEKQQSEVDDFIPLLYVSYLFTKLVLELKISKSLSFKV